MGGNGDLPHKTRASDEQPAMVAIIIAIFTFFIAVERKTYLAAVCSPIADQSNCFCLA